MVISSAYLCLGQYTKVLPIYDEVAARMGADTLNNDYALTLRGRAIIAEAWGNYYAANDYRKRYSVVKEELNRQLLESRAHEYAARYNLQEEQIKGERLKVKGERVRNTAIAVTFFALLAVLSCVGLAFSRRAVARKNKLLAEQLAEVVKVKAERPKVKGEPEGAVTESLSPQEMTDQELLAFLCDAIRKEHLFTDPTFGRQTLVERYKVSDRSIGAAFALVDGLPGFVRDVRLEHACQLLTEHPEMSIGDIAAASGFSSPIVFNRAFKAKHEITPTFYREQVREVKGERRKVKGER